jgi:hypothetical protein
MSLVRIFRLAAALGVAAVLQACAISAGTFSPTIDNVELLKKSNIRGASLGAFTVRAGMEGASSISVRGNPMASPVGSDYAAYLADAIKQELVLAGKWDPKSDLSISGTLLKNDVAAGGFSTNSGEIEARFVVQRGAERRYDATKRAEASWDSSFIGAVAIPKAQQQYPALVQRLLAQLYADPAFLAALR